MSATKLMTKSSSVIVRRARLSALLATTALSFAAAPSGRAIAAEEAAPAAAPSAESSEAASPAAPAEAGGGGGLFEQSQTAPATPAPAEGGGMSSAPTNTPNRFTLTGYTRGDMFVGLVPGQPGIAETKAAYGEISMAVKTPRETWGDGYAEARLRYGLQGDEQRNFADLREAYANAYLGPLDLRLGKQIIVWGRADALNPTNNLMPFDIRVRSPIEDDRRIGNIAARANLHLGPIRVEGVFIPLFIPSEIPNVGLPKYVYFGDPTNPRPELRNALTAGRVHLELSAIELSVSYVRGFAPLPGLQLQTVTLSTTDPSVIVSRTAYDQQVIGFDFSTALGTIVTLRGEAAYRIPTDYKNRIFSARPDVQYVVGVDHTFGSLSVVLQYMGRKVMDWKKENGNGDPLDPELLKVAPSDSGTRDAQSKITKELRRINQMLFNQTAEVQHVATARIEWLGAHDTLSISALGMYNVTTKEWLASPKIGYHLSDALMAYVGGEIFHGPDGTLFGLIDELLTAGYAELRYTF